MNAVRRANRTAWLLLAFPALALAGQIPHAGFNTGTMKASQPPSAATPTLPAVTVRGALERRKLRQRVHHFITSVLVEPSGDAFDRWSVPVCPRVAGLPKAFGEVIRARIAGAAADAHAPLAGDHCSPNLFVVAHDHVGRLLMKWWAHDRDTYDYADRGLETVKDFFRSRRAIRVWYNTTWEGRDGEACTSAASAAQLGAGLPGGMTAPVCSGVNTRLIRSSSDSNITSAVVVVDMSRMKGMTVQQLAAYITLVGLADVRLGADPRTVPSILELFDREKPPQGLTRWDRALLYSLYNTSREDRLQVPELELAMLRHIAQ